MDTPVQITFRGLEPTDAIKSAVESRAQKLGRYYEKIESCKVVIESPHKHKWKGRIYEVKIRLAVPGEDIVITREPSEHAAHEDDLYLTINDAFKEAQRRLEEYVRKRRRLVKTHEESNVGRVARVFPDEGYGFISTTDGRELYFHRNSVLDDGFSKLVQGTEVRFAEEPGDKGPQASTVAIRR